MVRRFAGVALGLWLGACGGKDSALADYGSHPLAIGASIDRVSTYQGVERVLMDRADEGGGAFRAPLLIANRELVLRVYASPERRRDWVPRPVAVVLEYGPEGGPLKQLVQRVIIDGNWAQESLDKTIEFRLPAQDIVDEMTYAVSIREYFPVQRAGIPEEELLTWSSEVLRAERSDVVELHLVPVRYDADGSGRLPDLSSIALERLRDRFYNMFPVEDVVVVVEPELEWTQPISPQGGGWANLLAEIRSLRGEASVTSQAYFYGLFNPTDTYEEFCGGGCTAGLAPSPDGTTAVDLRGSIGLGFLQVAAETLNHEIGHNHGRFHAPCGGVDGADGNFPYPNARLGSWGYDLVNDELLDPSAHADMMSYCDPVWVSDYTFRALLNWIQVISDDTRGDDPVTTWQLLTVDVDGSVAFGREMEASIHPAGRPVSVELLDASGNPHSVTEGYFVELDHLPGGMVQITPVADDVAGARVSL